MGGIEVVVDVFVVNNSSFPVCPACAVRLLGAAKATCPYAGAIGLFVDRGEVGVFNIKITINFDACYLDVNSV